MTIVVEPARAKINLCLHVVGQRPDGYHRLDSYVAFAEIGDRIEAEPSERLSLAMEGPFALSLDAGGDNLAIRAAAALRDWATLTGAARRGPPLGAALRLVKQLPVSSGIGGGSADGAATLRALARLWDLAVPPPEMARLALGLGADGPVCLASRPLRMRDIGETLSPAPPPPDCGLVLVNPGVAVATPEVFRALTEKRNPAPPPTPERFADLDALLDWLAETRNDLTAPAEALRPAIAEARAALAAAPRCRLARMSGSGATCFGLFDDHGAAERAADALRAAHPAWWIVATRFDAAEEGDAP